MDFENTGRANRKRRIFLDTETTGMSQATDRIVEVCAIEVDDDFNEIDSFHAFINPQRKVPWFVTRIHGLNNEFLDDKPIFSDIGRDLLLFLEGSELWAHNMSFDDIRKSGLPTELHTAACQKHIPGTKEFFGRLVGQVCYRSLGEKTARSNDRHSFIGKGIPKFSKLPNQN